MKKELKRQIKQDELVTGFAKASGWTAAHAGEVKATLIVVVVLAAVALGLSTYQQRQHRDGERAFNEALDTFRAPVAAELLPDAPRPAGTVHATAQEKFQKAAAAFDGVERRFKSSAAGRRAAYYAALSRIELGEDAAAEKALKEIAARIEQDALEPALARMALAELHRRRGQTDQAAEGYRKLAEDASSPLPRDHALMRLGALLEEAHRPADARESYRRVYEEFPSSAYAAEARRRAEFLGTARQG